MTAEDRPRRPRVDFKRGWRRVLVVFVGIYWVGATWNAAEAYWGAYVPQANATKARGDLSPAVARSQADLDAAYDASQAKDEKLPTNAEVMADFERTHPKAAPAKLESPESVGWKAAAAVLAIEAAVFAALSAIYLVLRWIVRGFIPKAAA